MGPGGSLNSQDLLKLFPNFLVLYHGETWELMARRWTKLEKDFSNKNGTFDISKVPDIYDCIKYDLQHNKAVLHSEQAEQLYTLAKNMADVVIPQVKTLIIHELYKKIDVMM